MEIISFAQTYQYPDGTEVWIREGTVAEFVAEAEGLLNRGAVVISALEIETSS